MRERRQAVRASARTLALAALLAGAFALCADAQTKDYGPLKPDGDYPAADKFFTRIDKDGVTAWRRATAQELQRRGFAEGQIRKFVRLQIYAGDKDGSGDYERGREGIVKINAYSLPVRFNGETGESMPFDPVAFAKALPDCYAQDERACAFKYSTQESAETDAEKPCLVPRRTVHFCKASGFVNRYAFGGRASGKNAGKFAISCGEEQRSSGCGADQLVFDDAKAQTKLAFDVTRLTPAAAASAVVAPADAPPKIVYHAGKQAEFSRREGPLALEEWEYDVKAWLAFQKRNERNLGSDKMKADTARLFGKALQYCWPHDVYHPCDVE